MNKKIDLSSIKAHDSILVAIAMIILAVILGVAIYFTYNYTISAKNSNDTAIKTATANIEHIKELEGIKADKDKYAVRVEKYNEVIADAGTYTRLGKQAELENLLEKYSLTGEVQAGTLSPYASVQMAESTVSVVGKESDVKAMCREILSKDYIVRIDSFAIADNGDGTVTSAFTIVDFTK